MRRPGGGWIAQGSAAAPRRGAFGRDRAAVRLAALEPGVGSQALEAFGSNSDAARIFFFQPLLSVSLMFVTFWLGGAKVRRAQAARDERLLVEAELRKRQAERLAGAGVSEEDLKALEEEVKALQAKEDRESEFVAFGEDTPTSKRYSFGIRPPPTDVSRAYKARFKDKEKEEKKTPLSADESNTEIAVVLLGTFALTVFLLFISG